MSDSELTASRQQAEEIVIWLKKEIEPQRLPGRVAIQLADKLELLLKGLEAAKAGKLSQHSDFSSARQRAEELAQDAINAYIQTNCAPLALKKSIADTLEQLLAAASHLYEALERLVAAHPCDKGGDCHCPTCVAQHALSVNSNLNT
jgi:hypothetical protein